MPLQKCSANNTSGWRWGSQGKCYTGPGAKKKAIKQGLAANPEEFKSEAALLTDLEEILLAKAALAEYNAPVDLAAEET
jgi:hypothetical protein